VLHLPMGFPVSVVVILLHPAVYMRVHTADDTEVKGREPESGERSRFHHCSIHHCCPAVVE